MHETVAIAVPLDHLAGSVINLGTAQRTPGTEGSLHQPDRHVARFAHHVEKLAVTPRNRLTHITRPSDVEIDGAGVRELRKHIEQHKIVSTNGEGGTRTRRVMRIAGIGVDRNTAWFIRL